MKPPVTRWGIAGTGGIAQRTLPDLQVTENIEVLAVSSRSQETAASFATEYDIARAYGEYEHMLGDPEVDVVYICTPHGSHFGMAKAAIEAGKHVLCEKPLTITASQARRLAEVAALHGVFLMEAMWMKFNPTIRKLQETVSSGAIGDVRYVYAAFGFPAPPDAGSRFWRAEQGGGALLDLGVYPITLAHLFLGTPDRLAVLGSIREDGVDGTAMVTLRAGDALAQAATSIQHWLAPTAAIAGTTGFIALGRPFWAANSFEVFPGGDAPGAPERVTVSHEPEGFGYVPMFRATSAAVLDGMTQSTIHPLSATIEVLDVVDDVRRILLDMHHPDLGLPEPWNDGSPS